MNKTTMTGALAAVLLSVIPAHAVVIKSYDFNGNLADSLGNGANFTASGGSLSTLGRYSFSANQGLSLPNALPQTTDYELEIKFQFNTPSSGTWNKLIDYENLASDTGFYVHSFSTPVPSYGIQFYPVVFDGPNAIALPPNDNIIRLTRNAATQLVTGYLNGVLQWDFVDESNLAVPSDNLLRFFVDDNATSGLESFGGSVDYIRISGASAVPEPTSAVVWMLLGVGTLGSRWRRRCNAT